MIEAQRIRILNQAPLNPAGEYVLYWAQMNRRVRSNHALAHAVELANELDLPVLFYEALTCSYPGANDRLHTFVLEAVPGTAADLAELGIGYLFYLRRNRRDANDMLYRMARSAAALVTDDYPVFVAAAHNQSVPAKLRIQYRAVDSSCVVPMNLFDRREYAAYTFRPKIRRVLAQFFSPLKTPRPARRFQAIAARGHHTAVTESNVAALVSQCDIDHQVAPSTHFRGGAGAADLRLRRFLTRNLRRYARDRNQPAAQATSGLSPYLHFGHISALDVACQVRKHAAAHKIIADEFLEELIVRRELAFNFVRHTPNYASLHALPDWAKNTLLKHSRDTRDYMYSAAQFEAAETHDSLWNAAQTELLLRGTIHGYYRMYWGKKIIEWASSHEEALAIMVRLHDRYALDGRDPNTYANILWCFGLHDRPWAERSVFGQVRYMSYEGMKRKTDVKAYIEEIAGLKGTREEPAL